VTAGEVMKGTGKFLLIITIIILLFLTAGYLFPSGARGQMADRENLLGEEGREQVDLKVVEDYWKEITGEVEEYLPPMEFREIFNMMREEEGGRIDLYGFLQGFVSYLLREVSLNLSLMGRLVILAVIAALLRNLQWAFNSPSLNSLVQGLIFMVLLSIALQSFFLVTEIGREAIDRMVEFILALVPLLLILLASLGSLASAAIFQPMVILCANFFSLIIKDLVFPLIFFAAVLMLMDHFSEDFKISRLGFLFRDASIFVITFCLTIFVGVLSLSGIAGSVSDGITLRTAKFLTGAFVPVVGRLVADAVDAVVGASLLFKNGLVLTGILIIFLITIFPLIKIAAMIIVYKLSSALIQPLGETAICDCLNTMGNCLLLIFAAVTAVSLMFFIVVIIIMGAGNAAVMLRA